MTSTSPQTQYPFHQLPLPSKVLQHHLTQIDLAARPPPQKGQQPVPDPTPNIDQRRSRTFPKAGHWARVTPLPIAFPYRLPKADEEAGEVQIGVEEWLGKFDDFEGGSEGGEGLNAESSTARQGWKAELLGVSEECLRECLPQLDVGNALKYVGIGEGSQPLDGLELEGGGKSLLDAVSGRTIVTGKVDAGDGRTKEYGPWSSRYAGHQFGSWAGQLGDGRAVSILETTTADGKRQEIQLKGAGRTPFARTADGLAVLRSGVREYLCAEAMAALNIPTSRSLALITHPPDHLQVLRENGPEPSSITARIAPSFIRIGNFEVLNPPEEAMNMQFFMMGMPGGGGGGRSLERDMEGLRVLGEWVAGEGGLALGLGQGESWGKRVLMESAVRNAKMVAAWQVYGFCHGVINTDNVSVLGITIDYGPYAFMDVYDPYHICNHSDHEGRYDYRKQPTMILFAMSQLLSTLAEIIGAEAQTGKAVKPGWAEEAGDQQLDEWRVEGSKVGEELEQTVLQTFREEYNRLYRKRFGLADARTDDFSKIVDPFLRVLSDNELDFHTSFRVLSSFKPSHLHPSITEGLDDLMDRFVATTKADKRDEAKKSLLPWLKVYAERVSSEKASWQGEDGDWEEARCREMRRQNPRFVLRQWLLEETIKKLEHGSGLPRRQVLSNIMKMATAPFEPYGGELLPRASELSDTQKEEQRLCGIGDRLMLGFQCSCSS